MRLHRLLATAAVAAIGCAFLGGCQRSGAYHGAVLRAETTATHSSGSPAAPIPAQPDLPLFGDDPATASIPSESGPDPALCRHTETLAGYDFDPDVDPTETTLVFASTRKSDRPDLYLKDLATGEETALIAGPADEIQPRFSPDGEWIAFCSNRSGNWDLWLVRRDGSERRRLTTERADEIAPCWSPDGRQIAFCTWGTRSHQWEIWTLPLVAPTRRRFVAPGMFPAWSADGRRLAFQRASEGTTRSFSIWTVELTADGEGPPAELVRDDDAACISPHWSPDGRRIVYCAVPMGSGRAELWLANLETGERERVAGVPGAAFNPVWTAGERIFFVSPLAGSENIWSVQAPPGEANLQGPLAIGALGEGYSHE